MNQRTANLPSIRDLESWLRYFRSISSESVREAANFAAEYTRRFGSGDVVFEFRARRELIATKEEP